ncbi:AbrB family transcriptional regulator [Skermanella sp. TT6]|nr:AbrB family transcriptional regulator [Skermanella sp. TT6]
MNMPALGKLLFTVALGAAGGGVLAWFGAPAAWLSGAMITVAAGAASGLPVGIPDGVRTLVFILLGTSIGSAVTPETIAQVRAWPGSLVMLGLAVAAMTASSTIHLTRVRAWESTTARFSSVPGALSQVLVMALRTKADISRIAFAQSLRLFVLVAAMPWLLAGGGFSTTGEIAAELSLADSLLVLAAGGVTGLILERLGVPGGALLGGMLASAVLHAAGIVEGRLPTLLLIIGFVVTGCVIGTRFRIVSLAMLRDALRGALESVGLALAVSALFAFLAGRWLGLPFGQLWLAYAPGGVEAMTIMAFALGLDPAFVGAHHVVRLICLSIFVPLWVRNLR